LALVAVELFAQDASGGTVEDPLHVGLDVAL
jgi:hypothetical protein